MIRLDLLGDPPNENRGIKGVKIGIVNKRKSGPALERGHTKPIRQYWVLQGMGNLTRKMWNFNCYADW